MPKIVFKRSKFEVEKIRHSATFGNFKLVVYRTASGVEHVKLSMLHTGIVNSTLDYLAALNPLEKKLNH